MDGTRTWSLRMRTDMLLGGEKNEWIIDVVVARLYHAYHPSSFLGCTIVRNVFRVCDVVLVL